ncbi:hypothetical protein HIM_11388 [Hirsutella minnesotensis 3608]|uniref:gamma-glutamylcyclotransferase n=1 Tax=Hirsutella minnesotensis 3608 TaxID=1043627 RepID=A0A0F7ZJ36_9HYPO|nr:hypothetical protein HIM_11388 [Hirsutella minnesotensis 3608]
MPRRSSPNPIKTTVPAALDLTEVSNRSPRDGSYPQSADIPSTPKKRLSRAAEGASPDLMAVPETVLYLAYGSNMAAATFLGMRGIRPLSQVNVSVPSLRLTLGLRGVPYREPCFANVAFRDLPERATTNAWKADSEWDGQLMGIVYEVTAKDWRTIMRTEGAGSSYKEIVVPCVPIGSKKSSADKTVTSDDPRPFLARTLYAAQTNDGHTEQLGCLSRLMTITRRPSTPGYAEASGRYLKLLRDGAKEHDLPASEDDSKR